MVKVKNLLLFLVGTHCTVIPEPLDVTKLAFLPTPETEHLLVLSHTSSYAPWLPDTISVHENFGTGKDFVIDGLVMESVSNLPTIKFKDVYQNDVLRLIIDPSFSTLIIESDLTVRTIFYLFKGFSLTLLGILFIALI